ncbi:MAG: polysaccharide deacetylase family protein [Victivallales bacterium]|jgi:peptidoglycan/xylan/chitin deacetylase (PgdA/CDA1 family)
MKIKFPFSLPEATCDVKTDCKAVALSFDDGPCAQTPAILDALNKHDVKAAFFVIGRNVSGNEETLSRIAREGHLVGNHSFTHRPWFPFYSSGRMILDLNKAAETISNVTGEQVQWFRPPYGISNPMLAKAVRKTGYKVMGWSIRSYDTSAGNPEKVLIRIKRLLKPGAVILLHDRCTGTPEVVDEIIRYARAQGYEFIRPDILFSSY